MKTLQVQQLVKSYPQGQVLNGLSFSVDAGEVYALLGQNGAGKTTTIHICLGLLAADSGSVLLAEEPVVANRVGQQLPVAYIPEVVNLYPLFTAMEQVQYFTRLSGQRHADSALEGWLLQAGLAKADCHRRVGGFSKGMRQKVAIAIALARQAELVVLDEPTSGLDPKAIHEFADLLRQLASEGKAVLMTTHDIFHAAQVATRIGILNAGKIVHEEVNSQLSPEALQRLYLETV